MKNNRITVIYKGYKIDIDYLKQQIGNMQKNSKGIS